MERLVEEMRCALNRMRAEGIEGWGLDNPDPEVFDLYEIGAPVGCTSPMCNHWSHSPAAPVNKLVPRGGWEISRVGSVEPNSASSYEEYFVTWRGVEAKIWRFDGSDRFWASLTRIQAGELPAWVLANLAARAAHPTRRER